MARLVFTDPDGARHTVEGVQGYNVRSDTGGRIAHVTYWTRARGQAMRVWVAPPLGDLVLADELGPPHPPRLAAETRGAA